MFEILFNITSSAFFAMGASIVIIVCIVLIIVPIMSRIKKLDDIVRTKLGLLPTTKYYGKVIDQLTTARKSEEVILDEFLSFKEEMNSLRIELADLNDINFSEKMTALCNIKTQEFLDELAELEKSLSNFSRYIRDNEKRSEIQLNNLVAARIDTTDVLIELLQKLRQKDIIDDIDLDKLRKVKENLQQGYDSVQRQNNYKVLESNDKSGNFDRFINGDY